jgi:hypothetical protein
LRARENDFCVVMSISLTGFAQRDMYIYTKVAEP